MHLTLPLLSLVALGSCWSTVQRPMDYEPYPYPGPDRNPTWSLTYKPATKPTSYQALDLAKECYNWVRLQAHCRGANNENALVVSGFWNEATSTMQFSTIPRGNRAAFMEGFKDHAPKWAAAALWYVEQPSLYCAEDGAAFCMEDRAHNGMAGGKYTPGSFIVAWGSTDGNANGSPWTPCGCKRGEISIPGCQETMERLGVTWARWPAHTGALSAGEGEAALVAVDQPSEDFSVTSTQLRYQQPLLSSAGKSLSRQDVKLALWAGYDRMLHTLGLD